MKTDIRFRPLMYVFSTLLLALLFACQGAEGEAPHEREEEEEHEKDIVQLSPEELTEFSIELAAARPGTITRPVELPSEVQPNENRL